MWNYPFTLHVRLNADCKIGCQHLLSKNSQRNEKKHKEREEREIWSWEEEKRDKEREKKKLKKKIMEFVTVSFLDPLSQYV